MPKTPLPNKKKTPKKPVGLRTQRFDNWVDAIEHAQRMLRAGKITQAEFDAIAAKGK
jgi:hypothetical protein